MQLENGFEIRPSAREFWSAKNRDYAWLLGCSGAKKAFLRTEKRVKPLKSLALIWDLKSLELRIAWQDRDEPLLQICYK
jgi:hypothetical protein